MALSELFFEADELITADEDIVKIDQPDLDEVEDSKDDPEFPPKYLMSAILAGLYELPPLHILKFQTGWGRKVQYDNENIYRLDTNKFIPVKTFVTSGHSITIEKTVLTRYFYSDSVYPDKAADFDLYRATISEEHKLNNALKALSLLEEKCNPDGLDVSNAGGSWHGPPNFFASSSEDINAGIRNQLYEICSKVITEIEEENHSLQKLNMEPNEIESWINISRSGAWNRLHTHEGSAWSGVYYVDSGSQQRFPYGGRLVVKPTPHPRENTYEMNDTEKSRFRNWRQKKELALEMCQVDACRYLDIDPIPGQMIIFPGWLHHCVLPSEMLDEEPRISIAFNVNLKG